jgi:hypothetical protein
MLLADATAVFADADVLGQELVTEPVPADELVAAVGGELVPVVQAARRAVARTPPVRTAALRAWETGMLISLRVVK